MADYDRGKGQAVTESILTKDRNYDFIIANNDDMILGALQVVKQFGLKISMVGVDRPPRGSRRDQERRPRDVRLSGSRRPGRRCRLGLFLTLHGVKLPKDILIPFTLVTLDVDDLSHSPTASTLSR